MPRNVVIKPLRIQPDIQPSNLINNEFGISNGDYNQFGLLFKKSDNKTCVINNIDYYTIIVEGVSNAIIPSYYNSAGIIIPGNNYGSNIKTNTKITKIFSMIELIDGISGSVTFQLIRKHISSNNIVTTNIANVTTNTVNSFTVTDLSNNNNSILNDGNNYIYVYINNVLSNVSRLIVTLEISRY